ncbi:hypothetical protein QX233_15420 [Chryseobacterium gambrini]|uniref:Uncharacterized protein n=1 Tax=Chryseobacterium gambrini TaxID=373672 RepID=A0AAJ1VKP5_9FLAO|nr:MULTISPECIES: hypothetical protein [Chryseobacterium]MDN4013863.1 hypothetical protein [Chryseobacterium gambrini]QWA37691.1 hypothetical protein KKI44_17430 [Chryseobacterium sp. ZHDP1]
MEKRRKYCVLREDFVGLRGKWMDLRMQVWKGGNLRVKKGVKEERFIEKVKY